jgi:hypothetical protein
LETVASAERLLDVIAASPANGWCCAAVYSVYDYSSTGRILEEDSPLHQVLEMLYPRWLHYLKVAARASDPALYRESLLGSALHIPYWLSIGLVRLAFATVFWRATKARSIPTPRRLESLHFEIFFCKFWSNSYPHKRGVCGEGAIDFSEIVGL